MVYFHKRDTPPPSLAAEKSYTEPDTIKALVEDFKNKCYICGSKGPTSLNVEHFDEHRGDTKKKYDWFNIFYACGHCNSVKQYTFPHDASNLLNCTDKDQKVDEWIEYRMVYDADLKKTIQICASTDFTNPAYSKQIDNTVLLLDRVYNGSGTALKNAEAENLVDLLEDEINNFNIKLDQYKKEKNSGRRLKLKCELIPMVSSDSPFAAFKRWIIRDQHMCLEIPFRDQALSPTGLILLQRH